MKIFLTGGTGFIGSYVARALSDQNHEIYILARNTGKVPGLNDLPGIKIIKGMISDFDLIKDCLKGIDACVHVALGWGDNAVDMMRNETLPTVFLMEESARAGVKKFVYTSSTAAVGYTQVVSLDETARTKPVDYYGATKASAENFLNAVSYNYDMKCSIIRPGYTFGNPVIGGAFMQPDGRFREIVKNAKLNQDIALIKNDGTQFIHAGNLAEIYTAVLSSNFNREIYFGLSTEFITWEKIAEEAVKLTGSKSKIIFEDRGYDEKPHLYLVDKIKRDFNLSFKCSDRITDHLKYLIGIL